MYLLYVDESGQPRGYNSRSSRYFVLAGMAIHEESCFPLARSLEQMCRRAVPAEPEMEIHASPMWSGRSEWARVDADTRRDLLIRLIRHLGRWGGTNGTQPRFFSVAVHKESNVGRDVNRLAHEELFSRFDSFLDRLHLGGDSHRSLVVSDESSYEEVVQTLVPRWRTTGSRIGKLNSLVEVPLFVNSKASRLVQAADLVAWATYQYYEHNRPRFLQWLNGRFDSADGVQHGLVHICRNYPSCVCPACSSRRTKRLIERVPKLH